MSDVLKTYNKILQSLKNSSNKAGTKYHMHDKHYEEWLKTKPKLKQQHVRSNKVIKNISGLSNDESEAIAIEVEKLKSDLGFSKQLAAARQPTSKVKYTSWSSIKKIV